MLDSQALQEDDHGTSLEVLPPVLFNTFKHHAGALRARIAATVAVGPSAYLGLAARLAILGTRLMDLYTGSLSPRELSAWILDQLRRIDRFDLEPFREWLLQGEEYTLFTHPDDGSRWVLRLGDIHGRYIHLHPARRSPHTLRVRANILKTAFLVLCRAGIEHTDPLDRALINEVRQHSLGLSPVGNDPLDATALRDLIALLRTP